jgi:hypothetical protein
MPLNTPTWPTAKSARKQNGPYRTDRSSPVEFVKVAPDPESPFLIPPEIANRIMIDVIHDGDWIPEELLTDADGNPIPDEAFLDEYVMERDWGASLVAESACRQLGIPGYHRVVIARVIMDFGRFPGLTHEDAGHLDRFALNYPFSEMLGFSQQRKVLENYYDPTSAHFEAAVRDTITKIAIHTYDHRNDSGTVRPEISVLTQATSYQAESEMPFGVFDPMYPDVLAEYTADRLLRDRLSLTYEKAGYTVAHNYPYTLPDGSIEVRAQVWSFFRYLRRCFEEANPTSPDEPGFSMVWNMLLDTNLRSAESEMLRSYLYMFRRVAHGMEQEFAAATGAYQRVVAFLQADHEALLMGYRVAPERLSSLGVEVRKDLIYDFEGARHPVRARPDRADEVAKVFAQSLHQYFTDDRPTRDRERPRHNRILRG